MDPVVYTHEESGLPAIDFAGHARILGCLPPRKSYSGPRFADRYETIPRSEWEDFTLAEYAGKVLDQNGQSSCVGHGSVKGFTVAHRLAGHDPVDFSPCFIYGQINGDRDQGAVVGDALDELGRTGVCLESEVGPRQIYRRNFPKSAYDTAAQYKALESVRLHGFDEIVSFLLLRLGGVSFGVTVGSNLGNLDSEGFAPRMSSAAGGHCMCGLGVKKNRRGSFGLHTLNSWTEEFGNGGYMYLPESYFQGETDHWGIRVVTSTDNPPAVA